MPRQPFLPSFAHLQYAIGALVLNDRPDLCAAIGRCIAIWAQADNEMGNLFSLLLDTKSDAALEVFLTLRRAANQRDALKAAAKHRLSGEELRVFESIMVLYGSLELQRNALAHGCFGVAANDTSVLLWIDIRDHVHFQTEILSKLARGEATLDPHERLKKNMYVYRLSDLQTLQEEMEQFWNAAMGFNVYLRNSTGRNPKDELRRIQEMPLIKTAQLP